jgi:predicted ATP-grasp superfamily ATP-dependent carboligase
MRILLTGSRSFVAIDVARALHRQGHRIYTADSADFDYVRYSNTIQASFRVPAARFDESNYVKSIISIVKANRIEKIIPLGEEVFYLARNQSELLAQCLNTKLHAGTIEQLDSLHNKYLFYSLAQKLGLQMPFTTVVHNAKDVVSYQRDHHRHIIIKPTYSRFARQHVELRSINETSLGRIDWNTEHILQDFVKGESISSYSFSPEDEVISYKNALRKAKPGAMASVQRTAPPEAIKMIDHAIRQALGYSGQLGLDFISTPAGRLYLLEANPRATIGASLGQRKGVQSRALMFHYMLEKTLPLAELPRFAWVFATYPDLLFRFSDIMPALASQFGGLASYLRFRRRHPGVGIRGYSSYDMEYNGTPFTFKVSEAAQSDSDQILRLLENLPTKSNIKMIYTRRPNAYTSFHTDGETVNIGLIKDQGGKVVVMGTCAENRYYIHGQAHTVGYIGSVRKDPDFPYNINWLEQLVKASKRPETGIYICSIIGANQHAIDVFTKKRPYLPQPKLIAKYTSFVVNPRQFQPVTLEADMQFCKLSASDEPSALEFLNREGRQYDFFPVIDSLRHNHLNVSVANSYVLKRDGKIIGFVSINNQNHKKQFIIRSYSWPLRLLFVANPLTKALGLMSLPKPNTTIDCPALTLCLVENNDKELYKTLVAAVASEIKPHHDMFMIALPAGNHNIEIFNNWHNFKFENNLYVINFSDKPLLVSHPYTEISLLL